MKTSVDSVLHVLSFPLVWGSLLVYVLYVTPVWIARFLVIVTSVVSVLTYLNNWYKVRGRWDSLSNDDIAVVTGGSNGLGLELVRLLLEKKVRCVVIDREPISDPTISNRCFFVKCDLSDENNVLKVIKMIKTSIGDPTILINNAAIRHSESLQELSYKQMHRLINVNVLAPTIFMKELLKSSKKRLYTVNISSILGLVSPANLSFYSSTKASLISLHDSISHECGSDDKRFLLVTPGQLDTRMFQDVKPPKQFLAPIVEAHVLAESIVGCIERGERGTLHGPMYTYFIPLLKLLPLSVGEFARWFSEMDQSVKNGTKKDA